MKRRARNEEKFSSGYYMVFVQLNDKTSECGGLLGEPGISDRAGKAFVSESSRNNKQSQE